MPPKIFLPQVTRIPVAGPDDFNTLVCVSAAATMGPQWVQEGKLSRFATVVTTPFVLAGFDQRREPKFVHSTTAWISSLGPIEDGRWLYAVDSVTDASFNPVDGRYFISLNVAISPSGPAPGTCMALGEGFGICFYWATIQATSWVLCHEPPLPPEEHHFATPYRPNQIATTLQTRALSSQAARSQLARMIGERMGLPLALRDERRRGDKDGCDC